MNGRLLRMFGIGMFLGSTAQGATIYVKWNAAGPTHDGSSWVLAYTSLQSALHHEGLQSGDRIFVAKGTYKPTTDTDPNIAFELVPGVALYGGFSGFFEEEPEDRSSHAVRNPTILSGAIGNVGVATDNSHNVVVMDAENGTFVLDRFIVEDATLACIDAENAMSVEIKDCIVRGYAHSDIGVDIFSEFALLERCTIGFNGTGIWNSSPNLHMSNCVVWNNTTGLVTISDLDQWDSYETVNLIVDNALFHGNGIGSGKNRGAMENVESVGAISCALTNCTLVYNFSSDGPGAGVHNIGIVETTIKSSILWGNQDTEGGTIDESDQIYGADDTVSISSSDVQHADPEEVTSGAGNINADPNFRCIDPLQSVPVFDPAPLGRISGSDLYPAFNSPCRDAGDPDGVSWSTDIDGLTREVGTYIDMGANEIQLPGACCFQEECSERIADDCLRFYVCDVNALHDGFHGFSGDCGQGAGTTCWTLLTGCAFGDADGNGIVTPGDRGFISANIGQTAPDLICLYDIDGNGVINPGDRGFVAANIGSCQPLPDYQDGSGQPDGECRDPRFLGVFQGEGTNCEESECSGESVMAGGGGSESSSYFESEYTEPMFAHEAGGGWYSIVVDAGETCLDGAAVFGVSDEEETVIDDASGGTLTSLGELLGSAGASPSPLFGAGFARRDMVLLDSLSSMEESGGELCQVLPVSGVTMRLEVYVWRVNEDDSVDAWSAALTAE